MPHNRPERQAEVDAKYGVIAYGGEYSFPNAILIALDAYITGGVFAYQWAKDQAATFAWDVVTTFANANPPVDPLSDPIYVGKFIFENWETVDFPGFGQMHVGLPNKFVPYVAARKMPSPAPPPLPGSPPFVEETTSIEQVGHDNSYNFAVRTPNHPDGGWVTPAEPVFFMVAAAAAAAGNTCRLRITYTSHTSSTMGNHFGGVTIVEIVPS